MCPPFEGPADNCLIITGRVAGCHETRYSPAGVPIARFTLEHHSRQIEAGISREVRCRIIVLACGEDLKRTVEKLAPGIELRVRGFIGRANHRQGEARLVLHAEHIDTLEKFD